MLGNFWFKKEKPLLGLTGMGGGVGSNLLAGGGGSSMDDNSISFKYHMHGTDTSQFILYVQGVDANGVWDNSIQVALNKTGEQHADHDTEWTTVTYDLTTAFAGKAVKFNFVYYRHSSNNTTGPCGDVAIDEFKVKVGGVETDISISDSANNWTNRGNQSSLANAKGSVSYAGVALGTTGEKKWIITSGSTPSTCTGPDMAADNNANTNYLVFESSGSWAVNTYHYYCVHSDNSFTVPS